MINYNIYKNSVNNTAITAIQSSFTKIIPPHKHTNMLTHSI